MGVLGLLAVVAILCFVFFTAVKVYKRTTSKEVKYFVIVSLVSLTTYFVHGFMNNFLDTDKASVPFWGLIALIVVLDVYYSKNTVDERLTKEEA